MGSLHGVRHFGGLRNGICLKQDIWDDNENSN